MSGMLDQIRALWARMRPGQKALSGGLVAFVVLGVVVAVLLGSGTTYRQLASGLDRVETRKLVAKLEEAGIELRVQDDGRDVVVDASRMEEARRILLDSDISTDGMGPGWRGLDDMGFSMTESQQKLRSRIAQEQELARTIASFDGVTSAKVHVTPPRRSWNRRDQEPAKASIQIHSRPGRMMPGSQVEAIVQLVSHAVDGLQSTDVVVTDSRGLLLSGRDGGNAGIGTRRVIAREQEQYLQEKAESALAVALGPSKAVVRIDADLDLEREESTMVKPVAESKVVVSEKIKTTENEGTAPRGVVSTAGVQTATSQASSAGSSMEELETVFDYERSTVRRVKEPGSILRLSIGVAVDESFADKQAEISGLVKGAVGYVEGRDTFELAFVAFAPPIITEPETPLAVPLQLLVFEYVGTVFPVGLAVLVGFLLLRSVKKARLSLTTVVAAARRSAREEQEWPDPEPNSKDDIVRVVGEDPELVARLVRNWLYEPVNT